MGRGIFLRLLGWGKLLRRAARLKRRAEDELKMMSAVECVKERRTTRQHGPGRGEVGQLVACTAWSEKALKRHGGNGEQRGRGEEAHISSLFVEADFYFSPILTHPLSNSFCSLNQICPPWWDLQLCFKDQHQILYGLKIVEFRRNVYIENWIYRISKNSYLVIFYG